MTDAIRRSTAWAMVAVAALAAACGTSKPAQARRGAGQVITAADQVDALAVGPDGLLYYGERVSGKVYSVTPTEYANPRLITTVEVRSDGQRGLLSLAVSRDNALYDARSGPDGRLVVERLGPDGTATAVWNGPETNELANGGHLAVARDGSLVIGIGERAALGPGTLLRLDPHGPPDQIPEEISSGWRNPFAITVDTRGRIWVADNAPGEQKELVGQGTERDEATRRRLATALPAHSAPSGIAAVGDTLYVCSYGRNALERLRINRDGTTRYDGPVVGARCQLGVVALPDGSLVTSTNDAVLRYPRR